MVDRVGNDRVGNDYTLTDAKFEDTVWLETLRRSVYQELFLLTWGRWDEARHQRHFAACLAHGCISIIHIDDVPVGMVQLFETDSEIAIGEIQILPTHQSLGIGTQVLEDIIQRSVLANKDVRLGVGLQNLHARRLYERLGFVVESTSQTHYHMVLIAGKGPSAISSRAD